MREYERQKTQQKEDRQWIRNAKTLHRTLRALLRNPTAHREVLKSLPEELKPEKILQS